MATRARGTLILHAGGVNRGGREVEISRTHAWDVPVTSCAPGDGAIAKPEARGDRPWSGSNRARSRGCEGPKTARLRGASASRSYPQMQAIEFTSFLKWRKKSNRRREKLREAC
jgi:hypothetical protein